MATSDTICPGPCNRIWRQNPDEVLTGPRPGDPVWCQRDRNIVAHSLNELPALVAEIRDNAVNGTPSPSARGSRSSREPAWPGMSSMLAVEAIADALAELEDRLRDLRSLSPRTTGRRDTDTIWRAVVLLHDHLDWLLSSHPDAADPELSPGAAILRLNRAAQRAAKADPDRAKRSDLQCPTCRHTALSRAPGDDSYECAICGRRLRENEYQDYVKDAVSYLGVAPTRSTPG